MRFACHRKPGLNYLCAGYKMFFGHIDAPMKTMASLLDMERAPAEIMRLPRSQWLPRSVPAKF